MKSIHHPFPFKRLCGALSLVVIGAGLAWLGLGTGLKDCHDPAGPTMQNVSELALGIIGMLAATRGVCQTLDTLTDRYARRQIRIYEPQ
jgi:hypothetical protein